MSTHALVTCGMCGSEYDPAEAAACASCPLGSGCSLSCCPTCGYSTVDVRRSLAARVAEKIRAGGRRPARAFDGSLSSASPRSRVRIEGIDELPWWRRSQLGSYGLAPGRALEVVQTSPLVVLRVEHVELAIERGLARAIQVTPITEEEAS